MTANYSPGLDRLDLTEMALKAPYVQLDGAGSVSHVTDAPELDLKGMLGLDWPAIEKQLARKRRARCTDHRAARGRGGSRERPDRPGRSTGSARCAARSACRSTRSTSSGCGSARRRSCVRAVGRHG